MTVIFLLFVSLALGNGCERAVEQVSNISTPSPTPTVQKRTRMDKETLGKLVESTDPSVAALIRDDSSRIEVFGDPIGSGTIYKVSKFAPTRMIIQYIGMPSANEAIILTADRAAFQRFAEASRALLARSEDRVAYGKAFLQIAVAGSKRFILLDSVNEVKPRPNLNEEQTKAFGEFVNKYSSIIKPATCSGEQCKFYAIFGQDLVSFDLGIASNGKVTLEENVVERNLLIPYAM